MNRDESRKNEVKWQRHQKSVIRVLSYDDENGSNHGSFLLLVHVLDVVHDPRLDDVGDVIDGDHAGS